ncbi:hypothetical protein WR25_26063 [Diploscapter pachys]|uniref:tRNA N(3)-methylcytidine methyltransferase n=1 Tax=Diploscapter pachys TaxID=2018661 RepID=A0A2A2K7N9_9BILA|nr:hypothetical protein WR25_26063 [Diploscapter pachys]
MSAEECFASSSMEPRNLTEDDELRLGKQNLVSNFKREKYEKEAMRNWNRFYNRNKDNFFKDRNWSVKEMQELCGDDLNLEENIVFLEAGCGVGNMLFPLQSAFPSMRLQAFDFSPSALTLLNERANELGITVASAVVDLTDENSAVFEEQADLATLIFVMSAIHPDKHRTAAENLRKYIKIGGSLMIRDYAVNDYAMIRFARDAKLGERFYVRQDGTRAYYFYLEEIVQLFEEVGFECRSKEYLHRKTINHQKSLCVPRTFIQARFIRKQ